MLLSRRDPNHITGPDLLDRASVALSPATASRDDESLTRRKRVRCSPRARLERYAGTLNERRIGRLKKRSNPYSASEPL